jgi:hypothetical protein
MMISARYSRPAFVISAADKLAIGPVAPFVVFIL